MVEPQFQADGAGSIPVSRSIDLVAASFNAHVAQSVEHFLGKEEVTGSIPVMSTITSGRWVSLDFLRLDFFFHSLTPSGFSAHGKG
jgi:hypothetical protein